jgi:hypothetical protein
VESIRGGVGTDGKSSCDLGSTLCNQAEQRSEQRSEQRAQRVGPWIAMDEDSTSFGL